MASRTTIENPVINSPFAEPQRHFRFTATGITNEVVKGRCKRTYFIPIPKPKLQDRQADPTTGQMRSNSTDDIACWFIDTNYNGDSFFVRHAYFTGAGDPYDKLKRALRAEIDEATWVERYSTTSRPFDPPETGKIAVQVINHYGDEVLKVFEVGRDIG